MYSKVPYMKVGRDCDGLFILIYELVRYGNMRDKTKRFHPIQSFSIPLRYETSGRVDYSMSHNLARGLYYA